MWPLRLLYGLRLGREEAADNREWETCRYPQDIWANKKQESKAIYPKQSHHDAVDKEEEMSLGFCSGLVLFERERLRGIHFWCNCHPIAFIWRSKLISNKSMFKTRGSREERKQDIVIFWGRDYHVHHVQKIFHDVGRSHWITQNAIECGMTSGSVAGGELFMPQQMEVQWGGGFLVNMYSMVVSGSPKRW